MQEALIQNLLPELMPTPPSNHTDPVLSWNVEPTLTGASTLLLGGVVPAGGPDHVAASANDALRTIKRKKTTAAKRVPNMPPFYMRFTQASGAKNKTCGYG